MCVVGVRVGERAPGVLESPRVASRLGVGRLAAVEVGTGRELLQHHKQRQHQSLANTAAEAQGKAVSHSDADLLMRHVRHRPDPERAGVVVTPDIIPHAVQLDRRFDVHCDRTQLRTKRRRTQALGRTRSERHL